MKKIIVAFLTFAITITAHSADVADSIPQAVMQAVYDEVRTPYKYGLVVAPTDNYHKFDCPTVFREGDKWLMTYVCYDGKDGTDGRGYETWLAESDDLLHWKTLGRILALPPKSQSPQKESWDENQRGGFPALIDWTWGGSYEMQTYKGRHWMTYIGGHGTGYEAVKEPLNIGLAWTKGDVTQAHQWQTADKPLLSINDKDAQWWEKLTQYKSTIYSLTPTPSPKDRGVVTSSANKTIHSPLFGRGVGGEAFMMFYNAGGINPENNLKAERIGIALSNDLKKWKRYDGNPVFANEVGGIITGDAQIVRMCLPTPLSGWRGVGGEALFVMFYFKAYDPSRKYNAFNTFAVSRDLIHWQRWEGPDLIIPSKPYDELFAHKSYVVKHDGVVYHFYCSVNNDQQRGIAVATSVPMGRSEVRFPTPEPVGKRRLISLNNDWQVSLVGHASKRASSETVIAAKDTTAKLGSFTHYEVVNLPHNLDDYYGYRQLRHGNLHGSAVYNKMFVCEKQAGKRYFLQFEGVGSYATVTLNSHTYPKELVGRTVWTLDVTENLRDGSNNLTVDVDHPAMQTESPWVCGGCSSEYGFSEGSQPFGIFRPVTLVETDEVRIEPFGVHVWANEACDSVFIETEVKNYSHQPATIEVVNKFAEKSGKQVFRLTATVTLQPGETKTFRQSFPIVDAHHWSLDDPYLYTLTSMLKRDGKTTDDLRTPFGIRSLSWPRSVCCDSVATNRTDNRFYLNGQPVFINGTCEYEHLLGCSHAFTPEQIRSRVKQIRNAGFNAFREAHQPHNLLYQQLFDEQGMLFWSQFSAHIWYDTPQFRENFKRLLVRWIKERRNSPSVILWGLQNESVLPRDFAEECTALIRSLDPTASTQRLVTTCNGGEGTDWNVIQNWSGTYGGSAENYAEELSRPDQLLNGEYGAWRTLDLHGSDKYSEESFTALLALKDSLARQAFVVGNASKRCNNDVVGEASKLCNNGLTIADTLGSVSHYGVCGHFQWLFSSHDNPGRVQPDGALRRIDKIGPINYKGLTTIWEEPTEGYYMYKRRKSLTPNSIPKSLTPNPIPKGLTPNPIPKSLTPNPSPKERGVYSFVRGRSNYSPLLGRGVGGEALWNGVGGEALWNRVGGEALWNGVVGGASEALYLYRINCGGDAYTDEFGQYWQADDSLLSHSWGQDFPGIHPFQASQRHITEDIRGTNSDALFQSFRFGRHRLWYDLPVQYVATESQQTEPLYRIELYFLEPWHGKGDNREEADYEGLRIFDVAVNDSLVIDDLDPWAQVGYAAALKRVVYAPAKNGRLRISFPEVKAGQAVIAAIVVAIENSGTTGTTETTEKHFSWLALDADTIAKLPKEELPQDTEARPATVYEPQHSPKSQSARKSQKAQSSRATTFIITPGLGQEYALRFRYKNTTSAPITARLTLVDAKGITLIDRELSFPPTPPKFKMLSTTTGTQINAGTYRLTIEAPDLEFKNLEIQ